MANLITLAELNTLTNTNLSATHDVDYLAAVITSVSDHVKAYCLGTLFETTTLTDERHTSYVRGRTGKLTVKLKYTPLQSVTTLKYRIGSTETTIGNLDNADLDLTNSIIYLLWYGPMWRRSDPWVTVTTYIAGHVTVPNNVKMATALLVQEWVGADDAAAGGTKGILSGYRIGNYSEQYSVSKAEAGTLGLGTTMSIRARDILRPYRRPGVPER